MRWVLLVTVVLGCGRATAPESDHSADIARLEALGTACWTQYERDLTPLSWQEVPEYVAVRPTVLELAQTEDPDVLRVVGSVTAQCGDRETLGRLARRSPEASPAETRRACAGSSEFFGAYEAVCRAAQFMETFCCSGSECTGRDGCDEFCAWGCTTPEQ